MSIFASEVIMKDKTVKMKQASDWPLHGLFKYKISKSDGTIKYDEDGTKIKTDKETRKYDNKTRKTEEEKSWWNKLWD